MNEEKVVFSIYGLSIEHPKNWNIIFSPKTPPDYNNGFVRIEHFIPKKGADISMSINWQKIETDGDNFASAYCDKIAEQYKKQMKKKHFSIDNKEIMELADKKAAFLSTEYNAEMGLIKKKSKECVKTIQLAFYDRKTKRAVVGTIISTPERLNENYDYFKSMLFTLKPI